MNGNTKRFEPANVLPKRPYSTPTFVNYGGVTALTQQQTTDKKYFGNDGNTKCTGDAAAASKPCGAS